MAILGITHKIKSTHGSNHVCSSEFIISLTYRDKLTDDFIGGIDHSGLKLLLNKVLSSLDGQYLDDIVGRATNENIALYILYKTSTLPIHSIIVNRENIDWVELYFSEVDLRDYPAILAYKKAESLLIREEPDLAIKQLEIAIELKNDLAKAFNLRGRCYKHIKRYDLALPNYIKAIELNPIFGEAYRNLGNAYYYLNQDDLMIPAFTKAIDFMPSSALAYNNRGYAYQKLKAYTLALQDHIKAIELDPNYVEAYLDRANVYEALKMDNLAQEDYKKAQELKNSKKGKYSKIPLY